MTDSFELAYHQIPVGQYAPNCGYGFLTVKFSKTNIFIAYKLKGVPRWTMNFNFGTNHIKVQHFTDTDGEVLHSNLVQPRKQGLM